MTQAAALFDLDRWARHAERLTRGLTDADRAWACKARNEGQRRRRLVRRALLRRVLARRTGMAACSVPLVHDDAGRPSLRGMGDVYVSTANTGSLLAVVVADGPVGVDIERRRPLPDWRALATDHFTPCEVARIAALPEAVAEDAVLRLWTMKEAAAKALGVGLPDGLPSLDLGCRAFDADALDADHRGHVRASERILRIDSRRIVRRGAATFLAIAGTESGPTSYLSDAREEYENGPDSVSERS